MKELDLFWIRHSVSFSNIYSMWEKFFNYDKRFRDPALIPTAEEGSCYLEKKMDEKIKNSKLIGCSEMKRSIQTAILMFPTKFKNHKIKVLKGIQEIGIGPGQKKQSKEEIFKQLYVWCKVVMKKEECKKLDNYFKNDKNDKKLIKCLESLYSDLDNKNFANIKRKNVSEEIFMESLLPYLKEKKISRFAIVSHSHYIRDRILDKNIIKSNLEKLDKNKRLYNNQILNKNFKFDDDGSVVSIFQKIYHFGCTEDKDTCCFHDKKSFHKCLKK